jgi:hypothetical protein
MNKYDKGPKLFDEIMNQLNQPKQNQTESKPAGSDNPKQPTTIEKMISSINWDAVKWGILIMLLWRFLLRRIKELKEVLRD